jgi:hypothetical protein
VDNAKINTASQEILQTCLSADDPVASLHAELDRLRATGEWAELELYRLQMILLDMAKQIVDKRAAG